jgi:hypothetical protein
LPVRPLRQQLPLRVVQRASTGRLGRPARLTPVGGLLGTGLSWGNREVM